MVVGREGTLWVSNCLKTVAWEDAKTKNKQDRFLVVDGNKDQERTAKI